MGSEVHPKPASPGNAHHTMVYYKSGPPPRSCATFGYPFAHLLTTRACDIGFDALSSPATLASLARPPSSSFVGLRLPHSLRAPPSLAPLARPLALSALSALSPSRPLALSPVLPRSLSQVSP